MAKSIVERIKDQTLLMGAREVARPLIKIIKQKIAELAAGADAGKNRSGRRNQED